MTEPKIVEYNNFLFNQNHFGNLYMHLNPEVTIEPLKLIADFCKGGYNKSRGRGVNSYLDRAESAINQAANELTKLVNNTNSGTTNELGGFAGSYTSRGNNMYCDNEGNCYNCNEPPIDNFDNCNLLSRADIDSNNQTSTQVYVVGDGNEARVGTVGMDTSVMGVVEGLTSIKTNTGAYERYLNMTQIYDNVLLDATNLGIGIICVIGVIQIVRP